MKNVIIRIFKNSENKEDSVVPPKQKKDGIKSTESNNVIGETKTKPEKKSKRNTPDIAEELNKRKPETMQKMSKPKRTKSDDFDNGDQKSLSQKRKRSRTKNTVDTIIEVNNEILNGEANEDGGTALKRQKRKSSNIAERKVENFSEEDAKDDEGIIDAPVDEAVYNVEALIAKKGSTYLVKWENYPDDQNTWEPTCSIPDLIVEVDISHSSIISYSFYPSTMKRTAPGWESLFPLILPRYIILPLQKTTK